MQKRHYGRSRTELPIPDLTETQRKALFAALTLSGISIIRPEGSPMENPEPAAAVEVPR